MASFELLALVFGDSPPSKQIFSVMAPLAGSSVGRLKQLVHKEKKRNRFKDIDAGDLILWTLNNPIPVHEVDARVAALGQNLSTFATEMMPGNELALYFATAPQGGHLHVIVEGPALSQTGLQTPDTGSKRKLPEPGTSSPDSEGPPNNKKQKVSDPADGLYPRFTTVKNLYNKLEEHKFIFVRGTPASGKSSLAFLLRRHIIEYHPEKNVRFLSRYRDEPDESPIMGWSQWLAHKGWKSPPNGVLILDEAQLSYWDYDFWLSFIKPINANTPYMVILFASYGSASRNLLNNSTPFIVEDDQHVGLTRLPTEDSVGLFLTSEEMAGVVEKAFPNHHFDVSLLDYVYSLTSGHVGACYDTLRVVQKDQSYRGNSKGYTYDDFTLNFEMSIFLRKLSDQGIFSRGLPMQDNLGDPQMRFVTSLREVIDTPSRSVLLRKEEDQRNSNHPLRRCLEQGWLFSEPVDGGMVKYRFASQLHELYTGWLLLRKEGRIKEPDLQTFVIEVIKLFSPQNLQTRGDLSTTPQSIPEAQFQQEFYRACCVYTGGCVTTFPECGTPKGRIDFFIRSKKWGVELLREGIRLHQHNSRFTTGEYGTWVQDGSMEDYILIDFRSRKPTQAKSDIKSLIYIVSTNNWESLEIYNSKLENITSFRLFYQNP